MSIVQVKPLHFVKGVAVTPFGTYAICRRVMKKWVVAFYPMLQGVTKKHIMTAHIYKQVLAEQMASEQEAFECANLHWTNSVLSVLDIKENQMTPQCASEITSSDTPVVEKSVLHLTIGDKDFEPTTEQLTDLSSAFSNATVVPTTQDPDVHRLQYAL